MILAMKQIEEPQKGQRAALALNNQAEQDQQTSGAIGALDMLEQTVNFEEGAVPTRPLTVYPY